MQIEVNGVRLFFDVDGEKLRPDGSEMKEKPTLLLLHGGPGFDHSNFKPAFSQLSDVAQLIYLDHRGNGRSDRGSTKDWNLDQWGDDIRAFCDALGIEKPIVMGQSFGGMVTASYASRHPGHAGKLIFSSTSAKMNLERMLVRFKEIGGEKARAAAEAFWTDPCAEKLATYTQDALSVYGSTPTPPEFMARVIWNLDVLFHFGRHESMHFDYLEGLAKVDCPTLVLGGSRDPVCPIEDQADIAAAIPGERVRFERFEGAGHGVYRDDPERGFAIIRDFIES